MIMSKFILWLKTLTMEETFLLTYGCIFAAAFVAIPIIWLVEKHGEKKCGTESKKWRMFNG